MAGVVSGAASVDSAAGTLAVTSAAPVSIAVSRVA